MHGKHLKTSSITDAQVLRAARRTRQVRNRFPFLTINETTFDRLKTRTGMPDKVVLRAMERAAAHGLIEYGVNIIYAWPVEP